MAALAGARRRYRTFWRASPAISSFRCATLCGSTTAALWSRTRGRTSCGSTTASGAIWHPPVAREMDRANPTVRMFSVRFSNGGSMVSSEALRPRTVATIAGDGYAIGTAERTQVALHQPTGRLVRLLRWPDWDRTVRPEHVAAHRELRLPSARSDNYRRRTEEILAQTPYAEYYAAYGFLQADRLGNLWVHRFEPPPPPARRSGSSSTPQAACSARSRYRPACGRGTSVPTTSSPAPATTSTSTTSSSIA